MIVADQLYSHAENSCFFENGLASVVLPMNNSGTKKEPYEA